ncbi:MAG: hypothetical protein Q8936_00490 [Bacillota bacterium]|nr:hypothetical protein [Bacillota bacterium]
MRKFSMLTFTILLIFLTITVHGYENYITKVPEIKKPSFNVNSSKFGKIKDIEWLDNFLCGDNAIIILASKENYSYLYYLNVENGNYKQLASFPVHKNLDDVILFDNSFSGKGIITAYDHGIVKTTISKNDKDEIISSSEQEKIDNFEDATSMEFKGNLYFTRANSPILYAKQFQNNAFPAMITENNQPTINKFYKKPYKVITASMLDNVLVYTAAYRDGLDLYGMNYDGSSLLSLNKPILENVITARGTDSGYGFIAMDNGDSSRNNSSIHISILRRFNGNSTKVDRLDSISSNVDMFGALPSMDATSFNEDYSVVYTSYDKQHKGELKVCSYNEKPKVIVDDQNIYGPVRVTWKDIIKQQNKVILYFTMQNGKTRAKICDIDGDLIKDITDLLT